MLEAVKEETLILLEPGEVWKPADTFSETESNTSTITLVSNSKYQENVASAPMDVPILLDMTNSENKENDNPYLFVVPSASEESHGSPKSPTNEYSWNEFKIPWNKIPQYMLEACEAGQITNTICTEIVHTVVNEMRNLKQTIPFKAFRIVGKKMADRYPKAFLDIDEDKTVLADGITTVVSKMHMRNAYLNRPHKRNAGIKSQGVPAKKLRNVINSRAGCSNWQPTQSKRNGENIKNLLNNMNETDTNLFKYLEETYSEQRIFLNDVLKPPSVQDIKNEWPVLLNSTAILWHFKKLTNVDIAEIDFTEKSAKILQFAQEKGINYEIDYDEDLKALHILSAYFKEDLSIIFYQFKVSILCLFVKSKIITSKTPSPI